MTRATTYWQRALAQEPTNLDLVNNLLFVYRQQNRLDRATDLLREAINSTQTIPTSNQHSMRLQNKKARG